ncbi:adenosylcobinamide-GDP ribazoletransferase [Mesobacillus maritimus]|uniref:adenosylcobinamide-GDP ribazoletransferase n=1 Tax=Mesobacillus maritimus TaxID=1643336 RepID=UPI00203E8E14|nr:adenosylcobinamide-GDP ribazoletransferase [Mesobacillus maritimus]MCM3584419.1 adenosylcobinamide-GDP ribazoletransferase [Mesobacillus maritimus]MCM3670848.1 adenosylcobinamide-GDP ribazoletransferase [Mesobacillus maritimus]
MKWLKGLLINFQFFTSVPIPLTLPMDNLHLEKAIKTFPILGLIQGGIYSSLLYFLVEWTPFSSLTAALVVWVAGIVVTGGIHLDGWMDASDAYFSYRDQEKRLEIMADPRSGAFSVLSVIVLLSTKFFFIYEITLKNDLSTYLLILLIPFFGKMIMGVLLLKGQSAKNEGLGVLFKQAATSRTLWIYPLFSILIIGGLVWIVPSLIIGAVILLVASLLMLLFILNKTNRWFGGITGDVLGAGVEGTEWLLWMMLWLLHYFVMG